MALPVPKANFGFKNPSENEYFFLIQIFTHWKQRGAEQTLHLRALRTRSHGIADGDLEEEGLLKNSSD